MFTQYPGMPVRTYGEVVAIRFEPCDLFAFAFAFGQFGELGLCEKHIGLPHDAALHAPCSSFVFESRLIAA
jgi:hypothetical protein